MLALGLGTPLALAVLALSIANWRAGDLTPAIAGMGVVTLLSWIVYRVGFGQRTFTLRFDRSGIALGNDYYRYVDIDGYGLSEYGGGILLGNGGGPACPRNVTIGWHISINHRGQSVPLTMGLKEAQAREAFTQFQNIFERYANRLS